METEIKEENRLGFIITGIALVLIIVAAWLYTYCHFRSLLNNATLGDVFNALNTLFSGLALAGIILTILLQRKELSLQRLELKETRRELARTAIAQEKSEIALQRQAENLKISAKLSALNTLVNFYTTELESMDKQIFNQTSRGSLIDKRGEYVRRIETILETKENGY